jgi:hypothetical protein
LVTKLHWKSLAEVLHLVVEFSDIDLQGIIECIELLCQGEKAKDIQVYTKSESYKTTKDIPASFIEEYECQNNLPPENYDLDGGFVGRDKERDKNIPDFA